MDLLKWRQFADRKNDEHQGPHAVQTLGGGPLSTTEFQRLGDAISNSDEGVRIRIARTFTDNGKYAAVKDLLNPGNPLFIDHKDTVTAVVEAVMGQEFESDPSRG